MSDAVSNLLSAQNIAYIPSGKDYLIRCLNPEHDDSSPSCRVDKISGVTHCFSCGWKRNIFKHFGVFTNSTPIRISKLKSKLAELKMALDEVPMPDSSVPYTKVFRGISVKTLKYFEAFYVSRDEKLEDRIFFPIRDVSDKIVAFNGRHVLSDATPKYLIYPSGRPLPCFPSKLTESYKSIVLVEGIFDMLNLFDKGVRNSICVFGVNTISSENVTQKLLAYKAQGVEKIFILFDGDNAGRDGAKKLEPILQDNGFLTEIIAMEEGQDPGVLTLDQVESLKEYIN